MERNYTDGIAKDIKFFVGIEIEKTPAYGLKTLFVTGLHRFNDVEKHLLNTDIQHIFFGANHSCNFHNELGNLRRYESMIKPFLEQDYYCSLDILLNDCEIFKESCLCNYDKFIPQLRVPIPNIKLWNKNTMLKIDDIGFNKTNPGIWTHKVEDLLDNKSFTDWSEYNNDIIIE